MNETVSRVVREGFNLNTIVALVGFLSMFATGVAVWSELRFRVSDSEQWHVDHEAYHGRLDSQRAATLSSINTQFDAIEARIDMVETTAKELTYRVTSSEKINEAMDLRIGRISESYSEQFTEIRSQLSSMLTQQALQTASLNRLEQLNRRFERGGGNIPSNNGDR